MALARATIAAEGQDLPAIVEIDGFTQCDIWLKRIRRINEVIEVMHHGAIP